MDFQRTDKRDNAGRFERGYLKVTTENLTNWDLSGREKPPKTNFQRCPKYNALSGIIQTLFPLFPGKMTFFAPSPAAATDAGPTDARKRQAGLFCSSDGICRKNAEKNVFFLLTSPETGAIVLLEL